MGSAPDPRIQGDFTNLASKLHGEYHGRVKLCLTYDEPLSHLVGFRSPANSPVYWNLKKKTLMGAEFMILL